MTSWQGIMCLSSHQYSAKLPKAPDNPRSGPVFGTMLRLHLLGRISLSLLSQKQESGIVGILWHVSDVTTNIDVKDYCIWMMFLFLASPAIWDQLSMDETDSEGLFAPGHQSDKVQFYWFTVEYHFQSWTLFDTCVSGVSRSQSSSVKTVRFVELSPSEIHFLSHPHDFLLISYPTLMIFCSC